MSNDAPNPQDLAWNALGEIADFKGPLTEWHAGEAIHIAQEALALRVAQPESGEIPPGPGIPAMQQVEDYGRSLRGAIPPSEPTEEVIQRAVDAAWRALWQDGEPQCAAPTEQDNEPFWRQIRAAVYAAQFGGAPPSEGKAPTNGL